MQIRDFKNVRSSLLMAAGYYENAVESLLEMVPAAELLDNISLLAEINNNLCHSYVALKNYELALVYAEQAIKYLNKHKRKYHVSSTLTLSVQYNLANIYLHYGYLEEVDELIGILSDSSNENINRRHKLNLHIITAKLYARKGEYAVAVKMLDNLQKKLVGTEDLILLKDVQKTLLEYAKQLGDEERIIEKQQMYIETLLLQQRENVLQKGMHLEYTMRKAEVFKATNRDVLTNLYNRRYMEAKCEQILETVMDHHFIAFLIFDVDYFKHINDAHGHLVGDEVLKIIAKEVQDFIKDTPFIYSRYGGDEFVLFLHFKTKQQLEEFTKAFQDFSRSLFF